MRTGRKPTLRLVAEAIADPDLEQLSPIRIDGLTPAEIGDPPRLDWLAVKDLRINRAYQRDLSQRSLRLVRKMVENFDWTRLKALSVLELGDGTYEVLDGQHTALAALSHGNVNKVPCLISAQRPTAEAAGAFVDLNTQRVSLTPMQIFWGEVAAGNEIACEVVRGTERGGGRVLKSQPAANSWRVGDTIAIGSLKGLAREGGAPYVKRAISIGVAAKLAPISRDFVIAFEQLIWGEHSGKVSDERIVDIVRIHGPLKIINDARRLMETAGSKLSIGRMAARVIVRLA